LKSHNGSAFKSEDFGEVLAGHGITWLPSPPCTPRYHGGCEAANGSMRARTDHFAQRTGGCAGGVLAIFLRATYNEWQFGVLLTVLLRRDSL
jgi:transposase InsO family protein